MSKDGRPRGSDPGAAHDPINLVLSKLPDAKPSGKGWLTCCPAHDDQHPSLSITRGDDGRALLHCHAGCATGEVCDAMGINIADLFPCKRIEHREGSKAKASRRMVAEYDYTNEDGEVLFQVVRFDPKDFRQRRPNRNGRHVWSLKGIRRVLYRLRELLRADMDAWIFIVEGEKDADALARVGIVATTNPGGAGKWKHVDDQALCGRKVCILPDNDDAGQDHAEDVAQRLNGRAADVPRFSKILRSELGQPSPDERGQGVNGSRGYFDDGEILLGRLEGTRGSRTMDHGGDYGWSGARGWCWRRDGAIE